MLLLWSQSLCAAKNPVPWKSLPPDLTMPLMAMPRVPISAALPNVPTLASSTML